MIDHKKRNHEFVSKTPPNKRIMKITDNDMDTDEKEVIVKKIDDKYERGGED